MSERDPLEGLLDREEVLGGLPAKRARTLVHLIENRTAQLVVQSRQAMQVYLTDEAAEERQSAFLEAFAAGREPPQRPSVQDLERHADAWAPLVARNPRVQAALAHALAERHRLVRSLVPRIRAALGLDDEEVQDAFARLYGEPLGRIYVAPTPLERLRWTQARLAHRLETLSPFWTAYALTLTETVGAGILALPIALAAVGPIAGVIVLLVLGFVNVVTVALMAESLARSGTIRYGTAYVGRAVLDYLGPASSAVLSTALFAFCFFDLMFYYVGFGTTLDRSTRVPDVVWVALLFAIGVFFIRRGSLNATVASALVIGAVNIALVAVVSVLGLSHVRLANLTYTHVPFLHGQPFDRSVLSLVFGVVMAVYFGHMSVSNCARIVLRRDPSSRSLVCGTAAAQGTAIVLYSLFVIAVNGAVSPLLLRGHHGTAIGPLADQVGPIVLVLGSLYTVLALGMASIHPSLGLFNLTREWLPAEAREQVTLARGRGRLLLRERRGGKLDIAVAYLGLEEGRPRYAVDLGVDGQIRRLETEALGAAELPELVERGLRLELETVEADEERAALRIDTTLRLSYERGWEGGGVTLASVLAFTDPEAELVAWVLRRGEAKASEAEAELGPGAAARLASLAARGELVEVRRGRERRYRSRPRARRGSRLSAEIWQTLAGEEPAATRRRTRRASFGRGRRLRAAIASRRGRALAGAAPVVVPFVLTEWLLASGVASFSGLVSLAGVLTVTLLSGIFPVLLLVASRQRGDYVPGRVYRVLGNRLLLGFIFLLSLAGILLQGAVVWTGTKQIATLVVGGLVLTLTAALVRRGAFAPRATVELLATEAAAQASVSVVAAGRPVAAAVELEGPPEAPQRVSVVPDWSGIRLAQLKVWAHTVAATGDSQALPMRLRVDVDGETLERDLSLGQVVIPVHRGVGRLELALDSPPPGG